MIRKCRSKGDNISFCDGKIIYFIESVKNVEVNGNTIYVLEFGGTMVLRFPEAIEKVEMYINFEDIHFENRTATTFNIFTASLMKKIYMRIPEMNSRD